VRQALGLGAHGFISKSSDAREIGDGIQAALRGEVVYPPRMRLDGEHSTDGAALDLADRLSQLTAQQFRVFGMLCMGRLNKNIARELQITEATVKAHMTAILRKLGASNRTQAVLLAGPLMADAGPLSVQPEEID
jgi:DNA-binding NarL/FixJ family response regulator